MLFFKFTFGIFYFLYHIHLCVILYIAIVKVKLSSTILSETKFVWTMSIMYTCYYNRWNAVCYTNCIYNNTLNQWHKILPNYFSFLLMYNIIIFTLSVLDIPQVVFHFILHLHIFITSFPYNLPYKEINLPKTHTNFSFKMNFLLGFI